MKIDILGVKIDNLTKRETLEKIKEFLKDDKQHYVVTPNPEFIVAAQKDKEFRKILNKADLALPDGVGLILVSHYLKIKSQILNKLKERITGVDLIENLSEIAEDKNYSLYLLGGEEGVAKKTAEKLIKKYHGLNIVGAKSGGKWNYEFEIENYEIINKINNSKPDILLVGMGQVKQEKWIDFYLKHLPSVKLAVGVGGSFDFISGRVKRAPKIMRRLCLEWFWRLIQEPWRLKRIFNATVKFIYLTLLNKS